MIDADKIRRENEARKARKAAATGTCDDAKFIAAARNDDVSATVDALLAEVERLTRELTASETVCDQLARDNTQLLDTIEHMRPHYVRHIAMVTGSGNSWLDAAKNAVAITHYREEFERIKEAAARWQWCEENAGCTPYLTPTWELRVPTDFDSQSFAAAVDAAIEKEKQT